MNERASTPRIARFVIALLWGSAVLIGYYYVHKPFSLSQAAAVARTLVDLCAALALTGLAGGAGRRLLPARELAPLERLAVQAALGWGLFGLLWLGLGLLGLYSSWTAWALLGIGWVILRRENRGWLNELHALKRLWTRMGRFGKALALGNVALVGGQLLFALAPPFKWDTLMYHLELPRRYLQAGRFLFLDGNPYWGHPQLGEMLYTWATALRGWEAAGALGWCFVAVLLLGVLGSTARRAGATAGCLAITALLVGLSFRGMLSWAYVDGLAALYGYAVMVALLSMLDGQPGHWYRWAACFVGFALGIKLTVGILLPIVMLAPILSRKQAAYKWWLPLLEVSAISLVVFLPWLLKNAMFTGNPLYPHIWQTDWMSQDRLAYYRGAGEALGWQSLWLPVAVTWLGVEGSAGFSADIGPLLALFALPGLIARWKAREARLVALWVLVGWLAVVLGAYYSTMLWQTRLYFIMLPPVAVAVGWGWEVMRGIIVSGARLGRVIGVLVILVLTLSLWQDAVSLARLNPAAVLLGTRSSEQYLDDSLGWYAPAMRALHDLPRESRPLLLWEPRGLYAPPQAEPDVWIDRWYVDRRTIGEPQAILQSWRAEGHTHLLVHCSGADFERQNRSELTSADWQALDDLLSCLSPPTDFGGVYRLYSLTEGR